MTEAKYTPLPPKYTDHAFVREACNGYERVKAERDELLAACRAVVMWHYAHEHTESGGLGDIDLLTTLEALLDDAESRGLLAKIEAAHE